VPADRPLRRDAERNRQRLLAAARELFAIKGLDVGLDEIAHHAGVGVGTAYRRFPDKEELIDALFEDGIAGVIALAEEALAEEDPWRGIELFLTRGIEMQIADRGLRQLVFCSTHGQDRVCRGRDRIAPLVIELIDRAKAAGVLRDDVSGLDMPLLQYMLSSVFDYASDIEPDLWRRYAGIVLDGLRARRDDASPLPIGPLSHDQFHRVLAAGRMPRRA
jgi:AcrR family transcriptional regulator